MVNGKGYVGSTTDLNDRKTTHFQTLKNNKHHNCYLQASYNKYGENNFEFYILAYCSFENLLAKEDFYMKYLRTLNKNFGYNLVTAVRHIFSEETKEKIRQSRLGTKASEETKAKLREIRKGKKPFLGHKITIEHKNKLLEGLQLEDTKKKMIEARKGKKPFLGHTHSEKAKQKMREARAKRKQFNDI